jgi:uncharacterized damage-inducible protein DinB
MNDIGDAFVTQARSLLKSDYLPKIERCLEKLTDENIWWRANADSNSVGNLLLHLSGNARQWIVSGVGDAHDARQRQEEFDAREGLSRDELLLTLRETLAEVDHVLTNVTTARLLERLTIQKCDVSVLEAIFHVVEHFSMHTGQVIVITKLLTQGDLRFYDFSKGAPTPTWHG